MSALALAVLFAIASAAAYAAGAVMQERLAADAERHTVLALLKLGRWWFAVGLNAAGGALHVAALAYGPLSLVQPLGLLTLVLALPMGAALASKRVATEHWRGAGLTIAGLMVLLVLVGPGNTASVLTTGRATTLAVVAVIAVLAIMVAAKYAKASLARSILYAVASGAAFAVASALTQTVTLRATTDGAGTLLSPIALVLAAMSVGGLLLSQVAYRDSGLGAPLATVSLANPIASAVIGMALLGERFAGGGRGAVVALGAAAVAAAGVVMLTRPADVREAAPVAAEPPAKAQPIEVPKPRESEPVVLVA
ncbi:DMT family transporter [Micromonospora sp. CPCC 205371]|nr:DMT family transporter [Micromonospora sp. CPCC 205371]